jgi:hypothetical protein
MDETQAEQFEARAYAAEDELTALRKAIRRYQCWLREPANGGPSIHCADVIARLSHILDA